MLINTSIMVMIFFVSTWWIVNEFWETSLQGFKTVKQEVLDEELEKSRPYRTPGIPVKTNNQHFYLTKKSAVLKWICLTVDFFFLWLI